MLLIDKAWDAMTFGGVDLGGRGGDGRSDREASVTHFVGTGGRNVPRPIILWGPT